MSRKNFQVTATDGKTYWISRSVAVCVIVYTISADGEKKYLLHTRGVGCPDNVGKLSVNCGYLDWDESVKDAAKREVYEETGFRISEESLTFLGYGDVDALQNITLRFTAYIDEDVLYNAIQSDEINKDTENRGGERDEIGHFVIMNKSSIEKTSSQDWAFGHKELILNYT